MQLLHDQYDAFGVRFRVRRERMRPGSRSVRRAERHTALGRCQRPARSSGCHQCLRSDGQSAVLENDRSHRAGSDGGSLPTLRHDYVSRRASGASDDGQYNAFDLRISRWTCLCEELHDKEGWICDCHSGLDCGFTAGLLAGRHDQIPSEAAGQIETSCLSRNHPEDQQTTTTTTTYSSCSSSTSCSSSFSSPNHGSLNNVVVFLSISAFRQ